MKKYDWRTRHKLVPAVYVILRKGGQVLLVKRSGTGYMDGFYSLPAGHLDGGEPALLGAVRELEEEVGIKVKPESLRLVHTQHRVAESKDHERVNLFLNVDLGLASQRTWSHKSVRKSDGHTLIACLKTWCRSLSICSSISQKTRPTAISGSKAGVPAPVPELFRTFL